MAIPTRPVLWPTRFTRSVGIGVLGAAALLCAELLRRPEYLRVSTAFVASSSFEPVLLAMAIGSVLALPRAPTDVAIGRDVYLRIAGVGRTDLVVRSIALSVRDCALSVAVCVVAAASVARVVLPADPLDPDVLAWAIANEAPVLADLAVWLWMVAAAFVVVALVHVATAAGVGRLLSGVLAPLTPVLAVAVPGRPGRVIEDMFGPTAWAAHRDPGWWSVLGGAVLWTVAALVATAVALLLTRRSQR
ncbi:MAG: hypothetical protein ACT4RN_02925 [Pseudonocardia sp.]